jgi:hypothetical protein
MRDISYEEYSLIRVSLGSLAVVTLLTPVIKLFPSMPDKELFICMNAYVLWGLVLFVCATTAYLYYRIIIIFEHGLTMDFFALLILFVISYPISSYLYPWKLDGILVSRNETFFVCVPPTNKGEEYSAYLLGESGLTEYDRNFYSSCWNGEHFISSQKYPHVATPYNEPKFCNEIVDGIEIESTLYDLCCSTVFLIYFVVYVCFRNIPLFISRTIQFIEIQT